MYTALQIAAYIAVKYKLTYSSDIDERRLQRLLYFVQRQSLAENGTPAFNDEFLARKSGPEISCIREAYQNNNFPDVQSFELDPELKSMIDRVFAEYANCSSETLYNTIHRELSWRNVCDREGVMSLDDMSKDADRLAYRETRWKLREFIKQCKSDIANMTYSV